MALGAEIRRTVAKAVAGGVPDVVDTVTIDTSGDMLIACLRQRRAVDTLPIGCIDRAVTTGTGLWNGKPGT